MEKRFELIQKENIAGGIVSIIMDKKTGVHYITGAGIGVSGMTPLLDKEGKVIISKS